MAAPTINPTLTNLDLANSTTNWLGFNDGSGGGTTPTLEQDIFIQGTAAVSAKISGASQNRGIWFDNTSGVDMTVANRHFYIWVAVTTVGILSTIQNGGLYVKIGSSTTNWNKYYVGGSDFTVDAGFVRYVVDLNKQPSLTSATPATLTSVRYFGAGINSSGSAKAENLIVDRIDYGEGLQIEDGDSSTPASWEQFFLADDNISNRYGIIERRSGVYFLKGAIRIGDDSGTKTSLWLDNSGAQVVFENPRYHNGNALVSSVSPTLYRIILQGNATGSTNISWGNVVGSGDARQGLRGGSIGSSGPKYLFDGETDIAHLTTVNLYGMTVQNAGLVRLSGSTKTDVIGTSFVGCDEVQPNDVEFLNSSVIAPVPDRGVEIVSSMNTKNISFIAGDTADELFERVWQVDVSLAANLQFVEETADANSAATDDWQFFPATEAVGDYCAFGSKRKFRAISIVMATSGSAGVLVWEYWSGSSWTVLDVDNDKLRADGTSASDNKLNLNTLGTFKIQFRPPNDWAATSLKGENQLYYVRARITTVYTTNPIGDFGRISDPIEHSTHIAVAGSYTYDALKFFGSPKAHVENASAATTEDSYAFTNVDAARSMSGGSTYDGVGQSFTGAGGVLTGLRIRLKKTNSPTGSVVAKLYAHAGTFGITSFPTGAALDTAVTAFDPSTLYTDSIYRSIDFEFEGGVTLTTATKYVITVEFLGGDASNTVDVGIDNSSPTHGGNLSRRVQATQAWEGVSNQDVPFFVYTGGRVVVNATNESNPASGDQTGEPPGATVIQNAVTLQVTGVTDGAQCSMVAASGGPETVGEVLMNEAANASGVASTVYNFQSNQPVIVRARSSGIIAAAIQDDGGVLTDYTFEARDRSTGSDVPIFPFGSAVINVDQFYFGGLTTFTRLLARFGGFVGVGSYVLTWEYWNGSTWSTLTTISTDDFKVTPESLTTWAAPGDWATTTVNSQGPYYYVRVRWTSGTMTQEPQANNLSMNVTKYRPFKQSNTITSAGLSVIATWVEDTVA